MVYAESGLDIDREIGSAHLREAWMDGERRLGFEQPPIDTEEVLCRTIARLETVLRPDNDGDGVHFPYIPLPYETFIENMAVMGPGNGRSFLDVGCGIGTKLVMAQKMGWKPSGIELHEPYLDVCREVAPFAAVEHVDANDYQGYPFFDLVYCYVPIIAVRDAAILLRRIVARMASGAYLFAPAWLIEVPDADRIENTDIWVVR